MPKGSWRPPPHLPKSSPPDRASSVAKLTELRTLLDAARGRESPAPQSRARRVQDVAAPSPRVDPADDMRSVPGPVPVAPALACEDIDLGHAFADVTRSPNVNRVAPKRPRPAPLPRSRIEDERDALEMSKYGVEPAPQTWDIGQEFEDEQTFLRGKLGTDVLSRLRRGHWAVQAVIDLHGLTTAEAHDSLADFLLESRHRGLRCVRIIHGKGLTSPNREPVLKGKVRRWLRQWNDVLAYCEAPRHAGGGGAVVALLRAT